MPYWGVSVTGDAGDSDDELAELEEPAEDPEKAVDGEVVGENRA